jgi:hypothetical protein
LDHVLARFLERRLEVEVDAARKELATADSEESEARLNNLQQQLRHTGLRGTTNLDDDDDFNRANG